MSKKILIVDDSRLSRMISKQFIKNFNADWSIEEAETGEDAIEKSQEYKADFVLLDVNMPGMGGLAAAAILKEKYPDLHIVMLTANVQNAVKSKAEELGLGFLSKPIKEDEIHAMLNGLE